MTIQNIKTGYYSLQEIIEWLEQYFPGEGFLEDLNERIDDFKSSDEEIIIPNDWSLSQSFDIALQKIQRPCGIFLLSNGNIRFLFENTKQSIGIQIQKINMQVVVTKLTKGEN